MLVDVGAEHLLLSVRVCLAIALTSDHGLEPHRVHLREDLLLALLSGDRNNFIFLHLLSWGFGSSRLFLLVFLRGITLGSIDFCQQGQDT